MGRTVSEERPMPRRMGGGTISAVCLPRREDGAVLPRKCHG
jgi:hypothetical protein